MRKYLPLLLLCLAGNLFAQQPPVPLFAGSDAPEWIRLIQGDNPNVFDVQRSFEAYYRTHLFEKNSYTQYYKRWMNWARPLMQPDGSLRIPTGAEWAAEQAARRDLRQASAQKGAGSGGWTFAGPSQTFDTDGKTPVSWQTNIYCVAIAPSDPNILYAGGESGGIWRTDDKGLHWRLLSAGILHGAVGAVAIHPTNPDIVYFGTSGRLMKSTDGGLNWTPVYSENNLWTNSLAINPGNPDIVLAAGNRGLLLSTTGGQNWQKVFTQECWTVRYKPNDANTAFAVRKNGSGSDFMRSADGGLSFAPSNQGWRMPGSGESVTGAIIAVCPSKPDKLYAYLCGSGANLKGYVGVFVSPNSGDTWNNTHPQNAVGNSPVAYSIPNHTNLMTNDGLFSGFEQGFYDMAIVVNPANDNELIAGGTSWFKSANGGASWQPLGGYVGNLAWSHPDIQDLAASGADLWIASDGGLDYSANFGGSIESRVNGISGADLWGFDAGWNEAVLVGGRYHNGNMAWHEVFPEGKYYRMGGAEAPTGYVNPGRNRTLYFSDIGGKRLTGGFGDGVSNFPVGLFPNESYAYYANSEMAWDPRCWNIVYTGYENKIWKSLDGGISYQALYAFPGGADRRVYDIEVSRANPDVLYCSQWDGVDDAIWRSADGGQSWKKLTPLPLPNNNDRVKLALSAEDPNVLWVAVTYGSNGKKVYKTTDGGQNWQNLSTPLLDGVTVSNIMAQYGTDGGVYLGTNRGVFYQNNSHTDWQPYSDGLPLSAETNRLKPLYRDGLLYNGCWGFGVWQAPLFEPSAVLPQAMCSALYTGCARDTLYFEDYSVVRHDNAQWNWQFPGASWVDDPGQRAPRAVYPASGNYLAIMTLTTPEGVFLDTLFLEVGNACNPDEVPGLALQTGGNDAPGYASLPPLNLNTNTLTVTAWVKPDGIQPEYSAIFMHDGATAGFNFLPNNNRIGYHWPGGAWWWDSGLSAPPGEWSHVAMTVAPDGITIYVNGKGAKHTFDVPPVWFDSGSRLGNYKGWGGRFFKGEIDEVCMYDRTLTQAEIREKMHLRKIPAGENGMVAYYQFNEAGGPVFDRGGTRHANLSGSAARILSDVPIGPGESARLTPAQTGTHAFGQTGLSLEWAPGSPVPPGEWCATRIDLHPDQLPPLDEKDTVGRAYWALHYFGTALTPPDGLTLSKTGPLPAGWPESAFALWQRRPTGHGPFWWPSGQAQSVQPGPGGSLRFENALPDGGAQLVVALPKDTIPVNSSPAAPQTPGPEYRLWPNPAATGAELKIFSNAEAPFTLRIFDAKGIMLRRFALRANDSVPLAGLPAGVYWYRIETEQYMMCGRLVVQ